MENNAKSLLSGMAEWLPGPLQTIVKSFAVRLDKSPIDSIEKTIDFTHSRASYIAQTALFGYLKARMGTRYRVLFEDEVFSQAIRKSAILIFTSCLSDFTIYITSYVARDGDLTPEEATILARQIFAEGLERGLRSVDSADHPDGALQQFQARTDRIVWPNAAISLEVFEQSASDLIKFAPVIDEFKALDREIVTNSIRFRWTNVRQQFQKRLDAPAVVRDWRTHDSTPPFGGTVEHSPTPL
jgi:hypothetical protein